jgi:hypothetical protein
MRERKKERKKERKTGELCHCSQNKNVSEISFPGQ